MNLIKRNVIARRQSSNIISIALACVVDRHYHVTCLFSYWLVSPSNRHDWCSHSMEVEVDVGRVAWYSGSQSEPRARPTGRARSCSVAPRSTPLITRFTDSIRLFLVLLFLFQRFFPQAFIVNI